MRVLITGANGHIGRRLIEHLSKESSVCAIVRSDRAAAALAASKAEAVSYTHLPLPTIYSV